MAKTAVKARASAPATRLARRKTGVKVATAGAKVAKKAPKTRAVPCVAKVARRKPSRRLSTPAKAKKPSVPVVLSAPTKKRSARAPPGRVVERLDFGAARREGSTYTETPDDGAAAPATADAQLAATLAHMATATSPPRLASAEAECVAVSYHGITGAPVYDSGLPYCSLDGLCPPEVIAEMRAKAYFAAMFSAEIAAGTLAAW